MAAFAFIVLAYLFALIFFLLFGVLSKKNKFKNPHSDYIEEPTSSFSAMWCFLFGGLYFLFRGIWRHVFFYIILAVLSFGTSVFIYPFFVYRIINRSYLRDGWTIAGDVELVEA